MNQTDCGTIRESLPDLAAGRVEADRKTVLEAHVGTCDECRAELELILLLHEAPPSIPADLAERVVTAVNTRRRPVRRPWWGISAAAIAAMALGIGVSADRSDTTATPVPAFAAESEESGDWLSDDGLLAGAPSVDGLSDEALLELLEELATEGVE